MARKKKKEEELREEFKTILEKKRGAKKGFTPEKKQETDIQKLQAAQPQEEKAEIPQEERRGGLLGLPGSFFRGVQKGVALPFIKGVASILDAFGDRPEMFSEENFVEAEKQLGLEGPTFQDPDVKAAAIGTGIALGGAALISFAPTIAGFFGTTVRATTTGAGRLGIVKAGEAGRLVTITRTKFAHAIVRGSLKGRGAITTARSFAGKETAESLAKQMSLMSKPSIRNLIKNGIGFVKKHPKAIAGFTATQGIMTWMASDNIMQGAAIFSRDVSTNVRFGGLTIGEAKQGLDEAQRDVNLAKTYVKISIFTNPFLAPFGFLLMANARGTQRQIDLQRQILGLERR